LNLTHCTPRGQGPISFNSIESLSIKHSLRDNFQVHIILQMQMFITFYNMEEILKSYTFNYILSFFFWIIVYQLMLPNWNSSFFNLTSSNNLWTKNVYDVVCTIKELLYQFYILLKRNSYIYFFGWKIALIIKVSCRLIKLHSKCSNISISPSKFPPIGSTNLSRKFNLLILQDGGNYQTSLY